MTLLAAACSSHGDSASAIGIADEPLVGRADGLPGVVVTIDQIRGRVTTPGRAEVGDSLAVDFTLSTTAGKPLELSTMARGAIMVSGPTFNYQRIIASQSDLLTNSVKRATGKYTYQFKVPVPSTYLAPLNDTTAFTEDEWTGQSLVGGTYTVGIEVRKDYVVDGTTNGDPGNGTGDFLIGGATTIEPREVVTLANCNQCHTSLRVHGNNRSDVKLCVLCHTSGAEDRNTATVAGGTPGISVDFKVMIHKIHSGSHLPSVLGVTTLADGTRKYDADPKPYVIMGFGDSLNDFSDIVFPAWPSFYTPMPRNAGYTTLTTTQQGLENTMRGAPVDCAKCHGDPDGAGPMPAPAQGDLIFSQPSIAACSSCHDDWVPDQIYTKNTQTMPIQRDSAACKECHRVSGTLLDIRDAHTHPLVDPNNAHGVHFDITSVVDADGNSNGKFEPGEHVRLTFQVLDDAGNKIAASSLSRIEAGLNGPSANPQMLDTVRLVPAYFSGDGPYTVNLPTSLYYEPIGTSVGSLQTFATSLAPHWNVTGADTTLLRRTGTTVQTTLAATAKATQNFIDVATGTASSFAKNDYIVIDDLDLGLREYMKVQWVDGDRLWFGTQFRTGYKPNLLVSHAINATVDKVTTATVPTGSYSLDATAGVITETTEFGNGEILCSYTSDFVVPSAYPGSLNDTPVNGEDWGDWTGLALLDGTYNFELHGARTFTVTQYAETTSYTEGADATVVPLLFGAADTVETANRISSADNCYACHNNLQFHGGSRKSFGACIECHGTAGAELTPLYQSQTTGNPAGSPAEFRYLLHRLHKDAFPAMPGGVMNCEKCHGTTSTAWALPPERLHPQQGVPTRSWRAACSSCHDSTAEVAHIDANTSPSGAEACLVCHGEGRDQDVRVVHRTR